MELWMDPNTGRGSGAAWTGQLQQAWSALTPARVQRVLPPFAHLRVVAMRLPSVLKDMERTTSVWWFLPMPGGW
ncbi:hypothetical protein EYF80_000059 [Liparis tanakae]|uniref:Uncharacterized protein n=1 Tax=Liparis tanakae TaxID=230148 RepID=A0A4Z2JGP2_9TELE|nr:hypothetical protein EYF80_000059 [Liparis tanakae]